MEDFKHFIDLAIAILLIFLFPIIYFGQKIDALVQTIVERETSALVEEIRSKGYLSKERYDRFLEQLSDTGLLYDVIMEHEQTIYEPEYRIRTVEEVIDEQNGAYTGSNRYHYYPVTTNIPTVHDPIHDENLNTETNESVLASAVDTPPDPNHVHTSDCYAGHRHTGDPTFLHTHKHSSSCYEFVSEIVHEYDCITCGKHSQIMLATFYWDPETQSVKTGNYYYGTAECLYCSSRNLRNEATHRSYSYSCGYVKDLNGDGYTDPMDRVNTYQYKLNYPQSTSRKTYTSGCYTYHVAQYIPTNDIENALTYLAFHGTAAYCSIPENYSCTYYSNGSYPYTIAYKAVKGEDGKVRLLFSSSSSPNLNKKPYPNELTYAEAYHIFSSPVYMREFINEHITIGVSAVDAEITRNARGTIDLCNHTEINKWYTNCGLEEDNTLSCSQLVVNIRPTHPIQKVYTGEPLITTAVVTYRDGSTKTVLCSTSFTTDSLCQNKEVILNHFTTIAGKTYTNSCMIIVTVIPRNKSCVHGHTYHLNPDQSDPGCPYCKAWLSSLTVYSPSSGRITIYRGTTLLENGVTLLATYLDGRTEYLSIEYVDNLDRNYVGTQNVTLSYKGHYTHLTVTTKRNIKLCPTCLRYYELHPDDSDPGCPYCQARTPIFTGRVMEYTSKRYNYEILQQLYEETGLCDFRKGDDISIHIESMGAGWGRKMLGMIHKSLGDSDIFHINGGYVREDVY